MKEAYRFRVDATHTGDFGNWVLTQPESVGYHSISMNQMGLNNAMGCWRWPAG